MPKQELEKTGTVQFTSLDDETTNYLRKIRSLTVVMSPTVASQRGFLTPCNISVRFGEFVYPATLCVDQKLKQNIAIVDEYIPGSVSSIEVERSCSWLLAKQINLMMISTEHLGKDNIGDQDSFKLQMFTSYLKECLLNSELLLITSMYLTIEYLTQTFILSVLNISGFRNVNSECSFKCNSETNVNVEFDLPERTNVIQRNIFSINDIGGYKTQINIIISLIDNLFDNTGREHNKMNGVLISGPSGIGKTFIGIALKETYKLKCFKPSLEDLKSKYKGETEKRLNEIFSKASQQAPSIIYLDDLDLFCGSGREHGGGGGTEAGIVTTLLHLLDGMDGQNTINGVLVIATSTNPQSLDAALRRPGRLSVDVPFTVPQQQDRCDILENMFNRLNHRLSPGDIKEVSEVTPGFTGGDLRSLLIEAKNMTDNGVITKSCLTSARSKVTPSALRSSLRETKVTLSCVCGYEELKSQLRDYLRVSIQHRRIFKNAGLAAPTRYLLFGPPGCGKTLITCALAAEFNLVVIPVKRSNILGKYFGDSERNLAEIFKKADRSSPCLLLFENFDGIASRREAERGSTDVEGRIINHLKVLLDGIEANDGVIVVAETNKPHLLDKDVIRQGRFHSYHYIGLPSVEDRLSLLEHYINESSLSQDITLSQIVQFTEDFSVAEVIQLCDEIKLQQREDIANLTLSCEGKDVISLQNVQQALENVVPNTSTGMLKKYKAFLNTYCPSNKR